MAAKEKYSGDTISGPIPHYQNLIDNDEDILSRYLRSSNNEAHFRDKRRESHDRTRNPMSGIREDLSRLKLRSFQDELANRDEQYNRYERSVKQQLPRLFIGGIGRDMTSRDLIEGFRAFGLEIINPFVKILKGKAFNFAPNVTFKNLEQYKRAVAMEKIVIKGRNLDIRIHRSNTRPWHHQTDEKFIALRAQKLLQKIDALEQMQDQKVLEAKMIQEKIKFKKFQAESQKKKVSYAINTQFQGESFEEDDSQRSLIIGGTPPSGREYHSLSQSPNTNELDDNYNQLQRLELSLQRSLENVRKEMANVEQEKSEERNNKMKDSNILDLFDKLGVSDNHDIATAADLIDEDPIFEESTGSLSEDLDDLFLNDEEKQHLELMNVIQKSLSQQTIMVMIKSEENINLE